MGIRQLNGTYVGAEDRILLRVSTEAGEEIRLWLTRSITGQLLAAIHTAAARTIAQKFSPQVAQTVTEFEQQAVRAQTRLDGTFLPGATYPLGEAPSLVVRLAAAQVADDISLDLTLLPGKNVNVRLPRQLAQQVGVLIEKLQTNAGWGLVQSGAAAAATTGTGDAAIAVPADKKSMH